MDPVSIVGVAAAAIQFCTFTTSVATATWRATLSSSRLTEEANDLEVVSSRFKEIVESLDKELQAIKLQAEDTHLSEMELRLQQICADCLPKAKKLEAASSELAVSMNKSGKMHKLWNALKGEFQQGNIQSLTGILSKLQRDVFDVMIVCSWVSAKETQNAIASLSQQMTALRNAVLVPSQSGSSQTEASAFVQDVVKTEVFRSQSVLENAKWTSSILHPVWQELKQEFEDRSWPRNPMAASESTSQWHLRLAKDIIAGLKFDRMDTRHDAIAAPHASTFEWIWKAEPAIPEVSGRPKWSSFPAWLESPSTTPYWVTGRPGSGKSTLMRFIEGHWNLRHHLSQWKPNLKLHILSYYAWNPGSSSQKSIEGLIGTILFQLLRSEPHLLPVVLPRRWAFSTTAQSTMYPPEFEAQDTAQLEAGLACLLSTTKSTMRLMIFLDGLDEFDAAPTELIRTVETISKSSNVKLCVASRPWVDFKDSFKTWPHLKIHDLTEGDISKFTHDKFQRSVAAHERPSEAEYLRNEIQLHAGGVFQWVAVVVNYTLDMLKDGDPLRDIQRTLRELPEELSDLYTAIWSRLAPERQDQAKEIFMLELVAPYREPLNYLTLWCVTERCFDVLDIEPLKETAKDHKKVRDVVVRLLNSRTLGLLELDSKGIVIFLHRTIPEWLETNDIRGQSTLQAHMASLQGLCTLGGHIDQSYKPWSQMLPNLVTIHLTAMVNSEFLSQHLMEDMVNCLQELEKSADRFDFRILMASQALVHRVGLVDLAALSGFTLFVANYLKSGRGRSSELLFSWSVDPMGSGFWNDDLIPLHKSWNGRLDLLRLCLEYDVTPYDRDMQTEAMVACSLGTIAQKFRQLADRPMISSHEASGWQRILEYCKYCKQVADIIETSPNYSHPLSAGSDAQVSSSLTSRFKAKVSSRVVVFKKKMRGQS